MNRYIITDVEINGKTYRTGALFDETGRMVEVTLEQEGQQRLLGNIYVGKVEHVMKNLNAAFVKITPEQRCYLSFDDLKAPIFTRKISAPKTLVEGDELLVQVTREAVKTKLPALTTNLSFSGTYAVITTGNCKQGVSSKLDAEQRAHFLELLARETDGKCGVIVRTNAKSASDAEVVAEIQFLQEKCEGLLRTAAHKTCYSLLYEEPPSYVKDVGGLRRDTLEEIVTDDRAVFERLCGGQTKIRFYQDDAVSLSALYSVKSGIEDALRERVWLKSGAYLVIEPTEALTVIDVNTGKNVAKRETQEHFLQVNLEAAEEIARQLRLRNISGIILVDFINLEAAEAQETLLAHFRAAVKDDPTPTRLIDMTKLGLVELTRKKGKKPLAEFMTPKASDPRCPGGS